MGKEEKKQVKRPTAAKRDLRNEKRRVINKSFKSNARTVMRSFEEALASQDKERIQEGLNRVYSVVDQGVKRRIYKLNKAARIKTRSSQKVAAKAS